MNTIRTIFLVAMLFAQAALANDRLSIYALPIDVVYEDSAGQRFFPPTDAIDRAMANTREALTLIGVRPDEYNLLLSKRPKETIICNTLSQSNRFPCRHEVHGAYSSREAMLDMMISFGYALSAPRFQGTALLGLLLLPDNFAWPPAVWGVNSWWSWTGFDPAKLHWTTTSCSLWSLPVVEILAHEIGHCFGLWHSNDLPNDPNYDGTDDSHDLMAVSYTRYLKPYNRARVRHHFRDLSEDSAIRVEPTHRRATPAFHTHR